LLRRRAAQRAIDVALRRGCHHLRVDTYGFQSPGFYEKVRLSARGRIFRRGTSVISTPSGWPEAGGTWQDWDWAFCTAARSGILPPSARPAD
jgi:hypothetical protein